MLIVVFILERRHGLIGISEGVSGGKHHGREIGEAGGVVERLREGEAGLGRAGRVAAAGAVGRGHVHDVGGEVDVLRAGAVAVVDERWLELLADGGEVVGCGAALEGGGGGDGGGVGRGALHVGRGVGGDGLRDVGSAARGLDGRDPVRRGGVALFGRWGEVEAAAFEFLGELVE